MRAPRFILALLFAVTILVGDARAGLERKGADVVLTDAPRCEFAWPAWDYASTSNPVLLTKNTLDRSMIGIMRIPVGRTLPRGKTHIAVGMTTQQITALLRENLQGRGQKVESITSGRAAICGSEAARLNYTQPGFPTRRYEEYGFIRGGYFFHFLFAAAEGPEYAGQQKDFEHVVSTFRVLQSHE
jgi:hypothetical protein